MATTTTTPLSAEDRAILELESERIAGHTCTVARLAPGAPDCEQLRARVVQRIALTPGLTQRLGRDAAGEPVWVAAEDFAVADHVVPYEQDRAFGTRELHRAVADLFERRLDRDRPLWRMDIVRLSDGERAIVWRLHHALADGAAAVRYARALLWDDGSDIRAAPRGSHRADEDARRRAALAGYLHREFGRSGARPPLDGAVGQHREVGFASVSLSGLRRAARAVEGATLNDAVLAIVGGALRDWLIVRHGPLGGLRVQVPVSLHHDGDDRDLRFTLGPLGECDPVKRLGGIRADTSARTAARDPQPPDGLAPALRAASPRLAEFAETLERSPRRFALSVSNVPGPELRARVLGTAVTELHSLAEIGERHALRVSVISMGDALGFGFCADAELLPDIQTMAARVAPQVRALQDRLVRP